MKYTLFCLFLLASTFCNANLTNNSDIEKLKTKQRLSIVFATQNIKTPVSMFGHTFLVAHDDPIPEPDALAIEFIGDISSDENGYLKALVADIPGRFRLSRFSDKAREYDLEDRSLLIFELTISEEHRKVIVERIVESIRTNDQRYSFFSKNCSFYLLKLIVGEDYPQLFELYTVPKRTILIMQEMALIKFNGIILSTQLNLLKCINSLNSEERFLINRILDGYDGLIDPGNNKLNLALQLAITYRFSREPERMVRQRLFKIRQQLVLNGNTGETTECELPVKSENSLQHADSSILLGSDLQRSRFYFEFSPIKKDFFNSASNDLSDSYLEMGSLKLALDENKKIFLKQLKLIQLLSTLPREEFVEPFTRYLDISYSHRQPNQNERIQESTGRFGLGISLNLAKINIGLIPFAGISFIDYHNNNKWTAIMGVIAKGKFWLNSKIALESTFTETTLPEIPLRKEAAFKIAIQPKLTYQIGLEWKVYSDETETVTSFSKTF